LPTFNKITGTEVIAHCLAYKSPLLYKSGSGLQSIFNVWKLKMDRETKYETPSQAAWSLQKVNEKKMH
jgi:hypothetical protein